jgi:hypothetical protein
MGATADLVDWREKVLQVGKPIFTCTGDRFDLKFPTIGVVAHDDFPSFPFRDVALDDKRG